MILNSRFVQLERHEAGADWKPYQEISRGLADISGYIIGVPATRTRHGSQSMSI